MTAIIERPTITRRRFTADEYHRMADAGILHEDDRIELIEGDLIEMAAISGRHAACVNDSARLLIRAVDERAIVSIQNPVRLSSRSEPEPDIMRLRPQGDHYRTELPGPDDVLLIFEVAHTSLGYARDTKVPLYAAAGIPEVWIADIDRRRILVYREPAGDMYREAFIADRGSIAPAAFSELRIELTEIFGPEAE